MTHVSTRWRRSRDEEGAMFGVLRRERELEEWWRRREWRWHRQLPAVVAFGEIRALSLIP